MKFWKKIYFSVFLLFLIFINGGIFLVYHISYRHNLEEEKTRMMGENEIIRRSLVDDISAFGKMAPGEREFRSIMEVYEDMFQNNRLFLIYGRMIPVCFAVKEFTWRIFPRKM